MDKSISKLTTFLKELFIETTPLCRMELLTGGRETSITNTILGAITMWLENEEEMQKHNIVSDDINILCTIFESIRTRPDQTKGQNFKDKEITNILFYCLKKNIENGILDETKEVDSLSNLRENTTLNSSVEDLINVAHQKDYYESYKALYILNIKNIKPNPNEVHILTLFDEEKIPGIRKAHKIIKEHYFDKIDTYTIEDVNIIIEALNFWEHIKLVEQSIRNRLIHRINKRKEPQKEVEIKRVERVQKPILTKKEYHEIKDELDSKFDFERMEPRIDVTLTPEEIAHCIDLMNQLSFTYREKEIFLEKSFKKSKEEILNIDSIMNLLQNQIEFYNINSDTVNQAMENIGLYMEEYKKTEDISEKIEWCELIKEEIRLVNVFIPKTFEYEKSMLLQKK